MAFSDFAYKDIQGHIHDIVFDGSFKRKDSMKCKFLAIFSFQVATRQLENQGYFPLKREIRENYTKREE